MTKTITLEVDENAVITIDGKPYQPEKKEKKWWRAEGEHTYYYIDENGTAFDAVETNWDTDLRRNNFHNYFKTESDAQLAVDFYKATAEATAFVPEIDESYWMVNSISDVVPCNVWTESVYSVSFPTRESAQVYADLRKRYATMVRGYIE